MRRAPSTKHRAAIQGLIFGLRDDCKHKHKHKHKHAIRTTPLFPLQSSSLVVLQPLPWDRSLPASDDVIVERASGLSQQGSVPCVASLSPSLSLSLSLPLSLSRARALSLSLARSRGPFDQPASEHMHAGMQACRHAGRPLTPALLPYVGTPFGYLRCLNAAYLAQNSTAQRIHNRAGWLDG